ncbi:MAG: PDZ domain-containing protein [Acidobacteriota bacterium]
MIHTPTFRWSALLSAAALVPLGLLSTPAAFGDDGPNAERRVERRVIVQDHDGGCPKVLVNGDDRVLGSTVKRGYLGVELTRLSPALRGALGVPEDRGVMIETVVEDAAAARAGLRAGDIVTRAGGEAVASAGDLSRHVRDKREGDILDLEIWRGGRPGDYAVTVDERERCSFDFSGVLDLESLEALGDLGDLGALGDLGDLEALGELGVLGSLGALGSLGSLVEVGDLEELGIDIEALQGQALHLSGEAMEEALQALQAVDWETHLQGLEVIELESLEGLGEHMEELEARMQELEERLQVEHERYAEEMARAIQERVERSEEAQAHAREAEVRAREAMERAKELAREQAAQVKEQSAERHRQAAEMSREAAEHRREAAARAAEARAEEEARRAEEEGGGGGVWM